MYSGKSNPNSRRHFKILALPFNIKGHHIRLSASIGIATDTEEVENFRELLHHAIHAMHEAKMKDVTPGTGIQVAEIRFTK